MSYETGSGQTPAGWYGNPQDSGRERWWDGRNWTEHYRAKPGAAMVTPAQAIVSPGSRACPSCGSQDAKTLKIIHAQGTSTGSVRTSGWVQGSGTSPGQVVSSTSSVSLSTKAARDAAPPKKRYGGVALIVIGVFSMAILSVLGNSLGTSNYGTPTINIAIAVVIGLVLMIGGVTLAMRDSNYNRNVFPNALEQWGRSWQCQRCGTVFAV